MSRSGVNCAANQRFQIRLSTHFKYHGSWTWTSLSLQTCRTEIRLCICSTQESAGATLERIMKMIHYSCTCSHPPGEQSKHWPFRGVATLPFMSSNPPSCYLIEILP